MWHFLKPLFCTYFLAFLLPVLCVILGFGHVLLVFTFFFLPNISPNITITYSVHQLLELEGNERFFLYWCKPTPTEAETWHFNVVSMTFFQMECSEAQSLENKTCNCTLTVDNNRISEQKCGQSKHSISVETRIGIYCSDSVTICSIFIWTSLTSLKVRTFFMTQSYFFHCFKGRLFI